MDETITDRLEEKLTVGVDLGDRSSQCCVLDASGEVLEESTGGGWVLLDSPDEFLGDFPAHQAASCSLCSVDQ